LDRHGAAVLRLSRTAAAPAASRRACRQLRDHAHLEADEEDGPEARALLGRIQSSGPDLLDRGSGGSADEG
ncbi:MAG: hypothetical protein ACRD2W_04530, partial [Acidimicrobiales bacterium]